MHEFTFKYNLDIIRVYLEGHLWLGIKWSAFKI